MSSQPHETSRRYDRPFRPGVIRLTNVLARGAGRIGLRRRLTVDRLEAAARRKTRLDDFGERSFERPLERLIESIETEARLTPVGRWIMRARLVNILCNRLRVEALIAAHPEIEDEVIAAPIVITGLPRTGTTYLHRLLAADPRLRALAAWESLNPAPLEGEGPGENHKRLPIARRAEKGMAYLAPDFFAVHPTEAEVPEEEIMLLDHSFRSTLPEALLNVPGFSSWLEEQDQRPAYEYLERLMKVLQWQRGGERWVLKTPHHMEWLDVLLDVFPDALIVWTHRPPDEVFASFCSLMAHAHGVFSDAVDPRVIGQRWLAKNQRMLQRATAVRADVGEAPFHDVLYRDLVADPVEQIEGIYAAAGRPFDDAARSAVNSAVSRNPKNKYGRHRYELSDWGVGEDRLKQAFAASVERFLAPLKSLF